MPLYLKAILSLLSWGAFLWVLFFVDYPKSLTQANPLQLLAFFTPLFFAISFSLYMIIKKIILCFIISLGISLLLILKALDSLNFVSGGLAVISVVLLVSYFKKGSANLTPTNSGLTSSSSIPKLGPLRRSRN